MQAIQEETECYQEYQANNLAESFDGNDEDLQAREFRKLLALSGVDVTRDLVNPEIINVIRATITNYDLNNENVQGKEDFAVNSSLFERIGRRLTR